MEAPKLTSTSICRETKSSVTVTPVTPFLYYQEGFHPVLNRSPAASYLHSFKLFSFVLNGKIVINEFVGTLTTKKTSYIEIIMNHRKPIRKPKIHTFT